MPAPESIPVPPVRFPFRVPTGLITVPGDAALAPLRPLQIVSLTGAGDPLTVDGLLDTGASVNVLPYRLAIASGAVWPEGRRASLRLGGNLGNQDAHPIVLTVQIAAFTPVRLAFAWTREEKVPLILGQTNFFSEFDVCFYRSRLLFDVRPKYL